MCADQEQGARKTLFSFTKMKRFVKEQQEGIESNFESKTNYVEF